MAGFNWSVSSKTCFLTALQNWLEHLISSWNLNRWHLARGFGFLMDHGLFLLLFPFLLSKIASAFGDPHFLTFDGLNFTFKGQGEYTLVESDLTSLRVQGRTQQARFPNGKLVREKAVMINNSFWGCLTRSLQYSLYLLWPSFSLCLLNSQPMASVSLGCSPFTGWWTPHTDEQPLPAETQLLFSK